MVGLVLNRHIFVLLIDRQILIFYSYRQKLVDVVNDDDHQIGTFFYV